MTFRRVVNIVNLLEWIDTDTYFGAFFPKHVQQWLEENQIPYKFFEFYLEFTDPEHAIEHESLFLMKFQSSL